MEIPTNLGFTFLHKSTYPDTKGFIMSINIRRRAPVSSLRAEFTGLLTVSRYSTAPMMFPRTKYPRIWPLAATAEKTGRKTP